MKTSLSQWIKTKGSRWSAIHWQSGYEAFSVSQTDADTVIVYIKIQPEYREHFSLQEEYRRLLERYKITYDDRYVWD
ncbi:MAG: transposase [Puniceicoccaceae bacterium]